MSDVKGRAGCPYCNGTGHVEGSWGLQAVCSCVIEQLNEQETTEASAVKTEPLLYTDSINVHLQNLIYNNVIGKEDLNIEYNRDYALKSLAERCEALHLKVSKAQVTDCLDTIDGILTDLRRGQLPTKSFAIGAENGIGKTTFATTAIKYAAMQGMKVVPYTDMTTLAEKYLEYSQQIRQLHEKSRAGLDADTSDIKQKHGWRDYVEADLAIVSLTGGNANIAYIELDTLLTLLARRADNRRPTIVLMRTPVEYYIKFEDVRKYLIKELFLVKGKVGSYRMLECHSMYTKEPTELTN